MSTKPPPADSHPCLSCGACCAYFRVQFYWREAERGSEHEVPVELTEDLNQFLRCMKGTNNEKPMRCIALKGRTGAYAYCSIYANRPGPCRRFEASYENGKQNKRCDEARLQHGMKPLTPGDWKKS